MESDALKVIPRIFWIALGMLCAVPSSANSTLDGGLRRAPSGGRGAVRVGPGMGMGILLVTGSRIVKTMIFLASPSRLNVIDSTLVRASMLTLRAGCGTG